MNSTPHIITDRISFGEGPVWCDDGTLVCVSIADGVLYKIWPQTGRVAVLVDTGGGPNGAALAHDGSIVVANNGGVDLKAMGRVLDQPPVRWVTPGLQWVTSDGSVQALTTEPMQAPNDLAIAPNGDIYFTDPRDYPGTDAARVMCHSTDGPTRVVGKGFRYTNGIAFDPSGESFVVVENDYVLTRWYGADFREREVLVEHISDNGGDGVAVDVDGRYYVAAKRTNTVVVFDRDGKLLETLSLPPGGGALVTNLCFGGDDLRTLFVTDSHRRMVVAFDGMPTAGLPLHRWPSKARATET